MSKRKKWKKGEVDWFDDMHIFLGTPPSSERNIRQKRLRRNAAKLKWKIDRGFRPKKDRRR